MKQKTQLMSNWKTIWNLYIELYLFLKHFVLFCFIYLDDRLCDRAVMACYKYGFTVFLLLLFKSIITFWAMESYFSN